jgi:hypothetical protein
MNPERISREILHRYAARPRLKRTCYGERRLYWSRQALDCAIMVDRIDAAFRVASLRNPLIET